MNVLTRDAKRPPKSKKILHKFTWNGERFQEEK